MALEGGPEVPGEIPQYCMRNVPTGTESVTDDDFLFYGYFQIKKLNPPEQKN